MLILLLCLAPLVALVLVYGVALVVAVSRAKPEDVPQMMAQVTQVLRELSERPLHRRHERLDRGRDEEMQ